MNAATAMNVEPPANVGARVRASDSVYGDILDFLIDEAALLDEDRHFEWLEFLAADIVYKMPIRKNVYRRDGNGIDERNNHWYENRDALFMRVRRSKEVPSAFDRDPPPRVRRMISNLVVRETPNSGEYAATSSLLVLRNRFDDPNYDILSAKREDLIRRVEDGTYKLARRLILVDQAALGAVFFNVFM